MPICKKCNKVFANLVKINDKVRNLCKRKYCIECSPFGEHNTSKIHILVEERACKSCGKKLNENSKKWKGIYCSNSCQKEYEWVCKKQEIENSGEFKYTQGGAIPKRYLREKEGIKCQICGLEKWNDKEIPLVLDHIDGNCENCKLINLRLICGNCDMQTSTYKGKNKGKGRHYRRERYKQGKSF
jgi:hypothetical protein